MPDRLSEVLRTALIARWNLMVPAVIDKANHKDKAGTASSEAFIAGYQDGYWQGISDFMDSLDQLNDSPNTNTDQFPLHVH